MPRPKGSVNKITSEIKEKIADFVSNVFETLDPNTMTQQEKLKFIQLVLSVLYFLILEQHTANLFE